MTRTASGAMPTVGDVIEPLSRRITQAQIEAYATASGDHNPIHLDADFARSVGLPGTIAHGMLDMGILAEAVARYAGGSAAVVSLACRFSKPLQPGDTLTCRGRVVEVDPEAGHATLELEATSDRGERVLTNGRAVIRLGGHASRQPPGDLWAMRRGGPPGRPGIVG